MLTCFLPPKIFLSLSSALIIVRFLASCSLFFLMYSHIFLVTWVRGIAFEPTTSASVSLGVIGFMNAALGFRPFFAAISTSTEYWVDLPLPEKRANSTTGWGAPHPRLRGKAPGGGGVATGRIRK